MQRRLVSDEQQPTVVAHHPTDLVFDGREGPAPVLIRRDATGLKAVRAKRAVGDGRRGQLQGQRGANAVESTTGRSQLYMSSHANGIYHRVRLDAMPLEADALWQGRVFFGRGAGGGRTGRQNGEIALCVYVRACARACMMYVWGTGHQHTGAIGWWQE